MKLKQGKTISAWLSVEDHRAIVRKAKRAGKRKSTWVRDVLIAALGERADVKP